MGIVRLALLCGLVISLYACAPGIQPGLERPLLPPSGLPGAEISTAPPLTIVYSGTAIYPAGSVLPDPEGLSRLESLALWLQGNSKVIWQVRTWLESTDPDASARAEKRRQLLARYFERKGLDVTRWDWKGGDAGGAQLSLTMVTGGP